MSSSISAQGVVERASAELSKRINGLGLRGSKHHSSSKTTSSVMERVTNVFCGGGNNSNNTNNTNNTQQQPPPEKPSRLLPPNNRTSKTTILTIKKPRLPPPPPTSTQQQQLQEQLTSFDQLLMDEKFLQRFFLYFNSKERCVLAQVTIKWRDILYKSPRFWCGLIPIIQCRELRNNYCHGLERSRLYTSLLRRGFHSLCLMGATDEDAFDLVSSFPLASKHIHSLSLRCSSVTDRGLETLIDHLQVCRVLFFVPPKKIV